MGAFWRRIVGDSQLRWVGPEKGVIHLATAAVVNAVWDLWAKVEGKPLWKLLADMTPEELVRCVDFRYITDALTPDEALDILRRNAADAGRARSAMLERNGYPAYTTSAGWLGYSDDKIRRLCREGIAGGWSHFKIKVGRDLEDDLRRAAHHPRGDRPGSQADDRRESGVGRRRGDRLDARAGAIRSLVDRGADEPRRRARPRDDRARDRARSASRPASSARTA